MRCGNVLGCFGIFLALLMNAVGMPAIGYTSDDLNRVTKVVYDDGTAIAYTYDADGNRLSRTVTED